MVEETKDQGIKTKPDGSPIDLFDLMTDLFKKGYKGPLTKDFDDEYYDSDYYYDEDDEEESSSEEEKEEDSEYDDEDDTNYKELNDPAYMKRRRLQGKLRKVHDPEQPEPIGRGNDADLLRAHPIPPDSPTGNN